ncbi:MAG: hypothetical protein AAGK80_06510 [Pseudomonadota bacterium]
MRVLSLAGLLFGLAACQGAPQEPRQAPPEITSLSWLAVTADPVEHLTQQPATCLTLPHDAAVQRGALLFESPMLLGGQAAKAGLSCATCHRNGRGNPDFVFTGISGPPGTADVTNGLFSKARADEVFNPVPIPDLASDEGQVQVDRTLDGDLEAFLSAQILEEFSGSELDRSVVSDLASYIRALDARVCQSTVSEPQSWHREIKLIRTGLAPSTPRSQTYRNAIRAAAGRLHERFPSSQHEDLRQRLIDFSRAVSSDPDIDTLRAELVTIEAELAAAEATSLYNPVTVAATWP